MRTLLIGLALLAFGLTQAARAFCGFYVGKADSTLYNRASQVVMVHDGNRMALTLLNDFKGDLSDFAIVIPVPEVLTREQINVGNRSLVERLDAYSAPRLVETFDRDPCRPIVYQTMRAKKVPPGLGGAQGASGKTLGVTVEARYTVGEYDILILGAKESKGLETWLNQNGYKLPSGASKVLAPYLKENMKFFVAKVNLKEQARSGFTFLRPLQFAFESSKFMLPLRLGMMNANGAQDLLIYAITRKGRVETTDYRTVKMPSGMDVPLFVKDKFPDFYRATFDTADQKESRNVVFLEYAWNMASCDPCAADPLTRDELRKLGVFWLDDEPGPTFNGGVPRYRPFNFRPPIDAFVTRLHVRYDSEHFPEDLFFEETPNQESFQARYVLRHPWTGAMDCELGKRYQEGLKERREKEAENLASLTGWKMAEIRPQMGDSEETDPSDTKSERPKKWYDKIFK